MIRLEKNRVYYGHSNADMIKIRLEKNRVYYGHSNADMINRVLGTSWNKYYKCTKIQYKRRGRHLK